MYNTSVQLKNDTGLHARPASMFVKEASKYNSEIFIVKGDKEYNAKSIMGVLSMGAKKGDIITITAQGDDDKAAVEALKALVESNFGE